MASPVEFWNSKGPPERFCLTDSCTPGLACILHAELRSQALSLSLWHRRSHDTRISWQLLRLPPSSGRFGPRSERERTPRTPLSAADMLGAPPLSQAVNPPALLPFSTLMILQSRARLLQSWASHSHSFLLRSQSRRASELVRFSQWRSISSPTPSCNLPNQSSASSGIQRPDFIETRRSVDMAAPAVGTSACQSLLLARSETFVLRTNR